MKALVRGMNVLLLIVMMICSLSCMNGGGSPWVGRWQLREYQYPDGSVAKVDSVFYGFQKGSFISQYMGEDGSYRSMYGYYEEEDNKITITLWGPAVSDPTYKKWFGWEDGVRTFRVDELTSKRIRLNYNDTIYVFRNY